MRPCPEELPLPNAAGTSCNGDMGEWQAKPTALERTKEEVFTLA